MYIINMSGEQLASFNKYDIRSVGLAEQWIRFHGFVIWKIEYSISGDVIVIVKNGSLNNMERKSINNVYC